MRTWKWLRMLLVMCFILVPISLGGCEADDGPVEETADEVEEATD